VRQEALLIAPPRMSHDEMSGGLRRCEPAERATCKRDASHEKSTGSQVASYQLPLGATPVRRGCGRERDEALTVTRVGWLVNARIGSRTCSRPNVTPLWKTSTKTLGSVGLCGSSTRDCVVQGEQLGEGRACSCGSRWQ